MSGAALLAPTAYPLHQSKVVHFVRHAQGSYNAAAWTDPQAGLSYDHFDANLTPRGWQQAGSLRKFLKSSRIWDSVELVVASPLTRTLQTASGVFGGEVLVSGEAHKPLMVEQVGKGPHKAISSAGAPPFLALELCREQFGVQPCDKRSSLSKIRSLFPGVDFSGVENEEDVFWKEDVRETNDEVRSRARTFLQWLLKRKEKELAVVSHGGFLVQLMGTFGDDCSSVIKQEMHRIWANCEMRTVVLVDRKAEDGSTSGKTDWPGGVPELKDAPSF